MEVATPTHFQEVVVVEMPISYFGVDVARPNPLLIQKVAVRIPDYVRGTDEGLSIASLWMGVAMPSPCPRYSLRILKGCLRGSSRIFQEF